ncbi:MAG: response regulator [Nitrospirales bacterium]|nr:response regulator [Nitrospirales bacterium]
MKIMVVDDCATTRKLLGLYLKSKGYEVVTAENGFDAIEKVGRDGVSLILADLNMPYMDGIELIRSLRADPVYSQMPVIMVTTEADPEEKERAYKAGANGYLIKPVTAEMVAQSIKGIMRDLFRKEDKAYE